MYVVPFFVACGEQTREPVVRSMNGCSAATMPIGETHNELGHLSLSLVGQKRCAQTFSNPRKFSPNRCTNIEPPPRIVRNQSPSLATSVTTPSRVHIWPRRVCSCSNEASRLSCHSLSSYEI